MKNVKKILAFMLFLSVIISCFSACAGSSRGSGKIKIIGTVFPHYDFARAVGGEYCDVEMLILPGGDSHSYSGDTPADILKISESDLFVYTGGESENWVNGVLEKVSADGKRPSTVALLDVCSTLTESDDGIIEAKEEHNEAAETDEHVWTSPSNAVLAVYAIRDALCEIDPEHSDYYASNAENYAEELKETDEVLKDIAEKAYTKTLVFADRFPFLYFAKEYGFQCYAAFNGCASQSEPSPTAITKLCEIIKENDLKAVFYTETSQSSVPEAISNATGAEPLLLHSCHTVTRKEFERGIKYTDLMNMNCDTLREALCDE